MNDDYFKQQADRVRSLAEGADPFTKKRLLDLAERYDAKLGRPSPATRQLKAPASLLEVKQHGGTSDTSKRTGQ
jgi:hypothetical protein